MKFCNENANNISEAGGVVLTDSLFKDTYAKMVILQHSLSVFGNVGKKANGHDNMNLNGIGLQRNISRNKF
jgi:hypothetical protein